MSPQATNAKIYSVSEITKRISDLFRDNFPSVWVEGEISNAEKSYNGIIYPKLKDENSVLDCVVFRNIAEKIKFDLKDGMKVLCFGRIGVYAPRGSYQLYIEKIEPKGIGSLQLAFMQLKEKLYKEGLFESRFKKNIPLVPDKIGIITSSSGAAIKDILTGINKRFPEVHIVIYPVRVQGKEAAGDIAGALKDLNRHQSDIDVIILGRGGGSLEDLWSFNEEAVARAIFESEIPVISAVGHEIDVSVSDFVADVVAGTPSKAAEMVIMNRIELEERISNISRHLRAALLQRAQNFDKKLTALVKSRVFRQPEEIFIQKKQRLTELSLHFKNSLKNYVNLKKEQFPGAESINKAIVQCLSQKNQKFHFLSGKLESLSPLAVLNRGYSITRKNKGKKVIKDINSVKKEEEIETLLSKGSIISRVKEVKHA